MIILVILGSSSYSASGITDGAGCGPGLAPSGSLAYLQSYASLPDYVLPIGQVSYHSDITGHQEVLPVTVDIVMGRGCDGVLFDIVRGMVDKGMLQTVQPGRSAVDGGEVLF